MTRHHERWLDRLSGLEQQLDAAIRAAADPALAVGEPWFAIMCAYLDLAAFAVRRAHSVARNREAFE